MERSSLCFGTLSSYFCGELWNPGPIHSQGTLEPWTHTFTGNFGTLGPYIHGELWNPGPYIHGKFGTLDPYIYFGTLGCSCGTLEPWAHTFMGNFGTLGPKYAHRQICLWCTCDCQNPALVEAFFIDYLVFLNCHR